jgi:endonuclease/exonuclease/phosphatase family metal-dependent hydrolase
MSLLWRQRQDLREPTLLAFAFGIPAFAALLVGIVLLATFLPVFGHLGLAGIVVGLLLAWLIAGLRRPNTPATTDRLRWGRRCILIARVVLIAILACWLGLIVWLAFTPGGSAPPAKEAPELIRVVTWNIHCGQDDGLPWQQFDWPARKIALKAALDEIQPDILCVQEARPEQVAFLEAALPGHRRVGGGRDDGKSQGEHSAICFRKERFELLADRTFWLEEPIDEPRVGGAFDVKRICTLARLRDRTTGQTIRVYNSHLYLTEDQNFTAVRIILDQIAAGAPGDAILFTADFNAVPSAPSRRMFVEGNGFSDSAALAGKRVDLPTFQLYGIGTHCLDGILVSPRWRVRDHRILDVKPNGVFPSDHFAVLADLALMP